jgi:hypothetical protein
VIAESRSPRLSKVWSTSLPRCARLGEHRYRNKIDQTAQEMSPPTDQERASSLRHGNEVTWTTVDDRAVAEDEVAAAWDTRHASTSRPKSRKRPGSRRHSRQPDSGWETSVRSTARTPVCRLGMGSECSIGRTTPRLSSPEWKRSRSQGPRDRHSGAGSPRRWILRRARS